MLAQAIAEHGWDGDSVITVVEDLDACANGGFPPLHEMEDIEWSQGIEMTIHDIHNLL